MNSDFTLPCRQQLALLSALEALATLDMAPALAGRLREFQLRKAGSGLDGIVAARFISAFNDRLSSKLIELTRLHLNQNGVCVFPKGATYQQEIDQARKRFRFECMVVPSLTDDKGAILKVDRIHYV